MFCPKCGKENEDNAAFCSSCGEKLNAPQAAEAAKGAPVVTATTTGSVMTGDGTTAVAAKKTGRIIGIIVAAVIVAAIVVAAITTGGFGLMGPSVKGSVNDYSWDELSKISAEISKASDESGAIETAKKYNLTTADGKLDGSQTKSIMLSDGTDVDVQITGFYHDDKASGGKAGITFIFGDVIAKHDMNSNDTNAGGWAESQMRSWLASDGVDSLPNDLRSILVEVDKSTSNADEVDSVSSVGVSSDKLWLYSLEELGGSMGSKVMEYPEVIELYESEGDQYKLYRDMDVDITGPNDILMKRFDVEACAWWTRSPGPSISDSFDLVDDQGDPYHGSRSKYANGVVPGFCI